MTNSTKSKEELLNELEALTKTAPKERKQRTDKGSSHNYPSQRKINLYPKPVSKLTTYLRVKKRLENRANQQIVENGISLLSKEFDVNGFYLPIPETYTTKAYNYRQQVDGRVIEHTTKRVRMQKGIDLEFYRFEAFREMAFEHERDIVTLDTPLLSDVKGFLLIRYGFTPQECNEAITKRQITWYQLFSELYYLNYFEAFRWTYDEWREYYDLIPPQQLFEDFWLSYGHKPGSPEFHPEWGYYSDKKTQQAQQDAQIEQERKQQQFIANMRTKK